MPEERELEALYAAAWSEPTEHRAETGGTDSRLAGVYARHLADELGQRSLEGLRIVDFGAGRGELGIAMRALGADVTLVDPYSSDALRELGFDAYPSLASIPTGTTFDGATSVDVVEHLRAPWGDLAALRQRLRPGGWLFIATPNPASLNARIRRAAWREVRKPGHIIFFTPRSAEAMLQRAGFTTARRLHWFVGYRAGIRSLVERCLLATGLDGALRYFATLRD